MTFEEWKRECSIVAARLELGVGDLWEEGDPYDLFEIAVLSYGRDVSPHDFVTDAFEEDLAARDYDADLLRQSLEEEDDFDEEG